MFKSSTISGPVAVAGLALMLALGACSSGGDAPATTDGTDTMPDPAIEQRKAITSAIDEASSAVAAVNNDATDAQVTAADTAIAAARKAISDAAAVPEEEKAANTGTVDALASRLTAAKSARQTAMDDDQKAKDMAMMATAMKLHMGISKQMGNIAAGGTGMAAGDRDAAYNTAGTAILVSIGGTDAPTEITATLSEDKKTMVADNHGWKGKKYMVAPKGDGMYEAVVYSNVAKPTEGKKFGSAATVPNDGSGAFQYQLTNGALAAGSIMAKYVDLPSVTRTAGMETFKLPDPNPGEATVINVRGSYHGVSGTYNCDTSDGSSTCTASVATEGFTLGGTGTWTFKPTDPNARVTEMSDMAYASYGWWIHKGADGTYTASAFTDNKGTAPAALSGIHETLKGKATYMGGAAGKYALYSSTGGTNDAGHFTAKAMLEADFNDDMITGTIDNFMGADGKSRNWSVELKKSGLSDAGAIGSGTDADSATISMGQTVWTIDGTAAKADGQWSGQLQENGDDGVPEVATGTFYSTYSTAGKMVGAFGVNKQ